MARPPGRPAARLARRGRPRPRPRRARRAARRSCSPARPATLHRRARPRSPAARRSCSRPATAPESFDAFSADNIRDKLQGHPADVGRAHLLARACPTVKVGRIAGQFAKPRSSPTETRRRRRAAVVPRPHRQRHRVRPPRPARPIPSGCVHGLPPVGVDAEPAARVHQGRLRRPVAGCTRGTRSSSPSSREGRATSSSPTRSSGRCGSWRRAASTSRPSRSCTRSTSTRRHEALLLGYEEALTRRDSLTGDWYDCSAHLLWIGERTRQLDGAHVEFLSRRRQPDRRASSGPTATPDEVARAVRARSTPTACPGRLTLDQPHGRRQASPTRCRRCCAAVRDAGHPVVWACDPMHGNTFTARERPQDPPLRRRHAPRSRGFFARPPRPRARGRAACTSSSPATTSPSASAAPRRSLDADLDDRYETMCDPRLNARQSLDLAFRVAELMRA